MWIYCTFVCTIKLSILKCWIPLILLPLNCKILFFISCIILWIYIKFHKNQKPTKINFQMFTIVYIIYDSFIIPHYDKKSQINEHEHIFVSLS